MRKLVLGVLFASSLALTAYAAEPLSGNGACDPCNDSSNTSGQGCIDANGDGQTGAGGNALTQTGCVGVAGNYVCTGGTACDAAGCAAAAQAGCSQ